MTDNSMAIAALCSHLCADPAIVPLEPREYSEFAQLLNNKSLSPENLFSFSKADYIQQLGVDENQAERLLRLLGRSASLSFEISKYESMGIVLITRADSLYPERLKKKLKHSSPPLFYVAGDTSLLKNGAIGYVGSRSIGDNDKAFTQATVQKTVSAGYAAVSGGARGTDSTAEEAALSNGGTVVVYLADSMLRKLRNTQTINAVQQGKLVLLSHINPDAGFSVGMAMMRNKFIYAQSEATVIVKADYNKGGTWAGAVENINKGFARTLCWNHLSYPGNKALIEKGAIPVDEDWDGRLESLPSPVTVGAGNTTPDEKDTQLSLFDS